MLPVAKLYDALKYIAPYKKGMLESRAAGDFEKEREYILKSTSTWGNHLLKIFDIKLNVTGKENLPQSGPVVFVANHQGYADIPICCTTLDKFQFGFVAKNDLGKIPLYGNWIKSLRSVMIERDDARASLRAIEEGIDLIEKGFSLVIFPEGTRSSGGPMKQFKKGSLRLATKSGVPLIPVTINGSWRAFEETGVIRKGTPVDIVIHPVIETKNMNRNDANNLSGQVEEIIKNQLELLAQKNNHV